MQKRKRNSLGYMASLYDAKRTRLEMGADPSATRNREPRTLEINGIFRSFTPHGGSGPVPNLNEIDSAPELDEWNSPTALQILQTEVADLDKPQNTENRGLLWDKVYKASTRRVEIVREETPSLEDENRQARLNDDDDGPAERQPVRNASSEQFPKAWKSGHPYVFLPPFKALDQDAWELIRVAMEKYDKEMCKAWNGELDTILVFTGLFSAAVTAFCLESFQNLTYNPVDTTNTFLLAISLQLANSSSPVANAAIANAFKPEKHDVHINILYFISLAFALSVSSVCILGKQWIREYEKDVVGTPCDAVRVRQMRYDALESWKVPQIVAALPVLVIAALLLFFTGLLIQLWHVSEHTTAISVSAIIALTACLVIVTTIAPAYYGLSPTSRAAFVPFRSPQAWLWFVTCRRLQGMFRGMFHMERFPKANVHNWTELDLHILLIETNPWFQHGISSVHRALRWVYQTLLMSDTMESCAYWCLDSPQNFPHELINDPNHLTRYVLAEEVESLSGNTYSHVTTARIRYDASIRKHGRVDVQNPLGQHQVELLIRVINDTIDSIIDGRYVSERKECMDHWKEITDCFGWLMIEHKLHDFSNEDLKYRHDIELQIALMLRRLFITLSDAPSHVSLPREFWDQCSSFLKTRRWYSTDSLLIKAHGLALRDLPKALSKRHPMEIVLDIAERALHSGLVESEKLYPEFDEAIFNSWNVGGVDECTKENLVRWRKFRVGSIDQSRHRPSLDNSEGGLPDGYFESMHGPLPTLDLSPIPLPRVGRFFSTFTTK